VVSLFEVDELVLQYPSIYGVSSPAKSLKLAYKLNNLNRLFVEAIENIKTYSKTSSHQAYLISDLDTEESAFLIKNRGSNGFYFPSFKKVDYLLCSATDDELNQELIKLISELMTVSICFALSEPNPKELLNFTQLL